MKETRTYPLRLPRSLKEVSEKVSALQTASFFADRKARADFAAFDKIMKRRGGKPPREGDDPSS